MGDTDDDLDDEFRNMTLDLKVRTDMLNSDDLQYGFPIKPMAPLTYDDYVSTDGLAVSDDDNNDNDQPLSQLSDEDNDDEGRSDLALLPAAKQTQV